MLETFTFYIYIMSTSLYLITRMLISEYNNTRYSDIIKQTTDIIVYSEKNLVWYAFNVVQVFMPPVLIYGVSKDEFLKAPKDTSTGYKIVMISLWVLHILQFAF